MANLSMRWPCVLIGCVDSVDRGSGWTVAVPQQRKGLTAKKVAIAMYRDWWEPFGILSIITSDIGQQFAGA